MSPGLLNPAPAARDVDRDDERDEDLYEMFGVERVEQPPMGYQEVILANRLGWLLASFVTTHDLGWVVVEALFSLRPAVERSRRPDAAFVSFERWSKLRRGGRGDAWPVVPDLAVEVVSPNDLASDLVVKIQEYFAAGVRLVWVVYPAVDQVHVYRSPTEITAYRRGDGLDAEPVLPGFRLDVAELFGPEDPIREAVGAEA